MAAEPDATIPILTEAVDRLEADIAHEPAQQSAATLDALSASGAQPELQLEHDPASEIETLIAELQTQIAAGAFAMTDEIMRAAFAEMEAAVFEKISGRLRRELPEMIDRKLRERLRELPDY